MNILTAREAGLQDGIKHGPAQLLAALVKRGLKEEHLTATARFILAWDAHAPLNEPERPEAVRAHEVSTRPERLFDPDDGLTEACSASDGVRYVRDAA